MKNIKNILSLLFLSQITITPVIGQNSGKTEYINVKSCVTDAQGKPVKGAKVYVDGNFGSTVTDASGRFALKVKPTDRLYIKSEGYLSKTVSAKDVDSKIDMDETPYLQGEDNQVDLGFIKVDKRDVNSDITTVKTSDIDGKYNPRGITDILNGNVSGMANYNNVRGLGNALVVVDGVIRYDAFSSAMMMPEEIESVTVLKDVAAVALFGSQARNGAILIQTKHGNAHERSIRINARYGINDPKALPQYLNSADYMTLYNEARTNDGLSPLYSDQTIENYRSGNPYRYPSVDYYSSDYLKSVQTNSRVSADFTGGDKNVSYYANLGWSHDGSWINFGDAKSQGTNRFNLRTNVDFRINDFIKNSVSANAVFNFSKGPRTDYFSNASTLKPNAYTPFLPISLLDETNTDMMNLVSIERNVIGGTYILGGTSSIKTNPFADIYAGGYNETINRVMEINDRIDVDLNALTKGLSFVGNIGFDFYNRYQQYVSNGYAVYVPTWDTNDKITALTKYNDNTYTGVQYVGSPNFYRRLAFSGMLNYERSFADVHHLSAQLIASGSNYTVFTPNNNGNASDPWPEKNTHLGMRVAYDYKKTYYADFSSALQYSTKLASGHRLGFSPTIALGWTISNEKFMKDIKWIDFLKLRATAGILCSDESIGGYYYYDHTYAQYGSFAWNENNNSNQLVYSEKGGNTNFGYEKRKEFNIGLLGEFFNKSLTLDVDYFNMRITDKPGRLSNNYPTYQGGFAPYGNNAGTDSYKGLEFSADYKKQIGDVSVDLGATGMYRTSKVIKRDEFYSENYMYRAGRPTDAIFGYEALGLFQSADEIKNSPTQTFGDVKPGDIKYKDQNGDGIIDANDQVQIGKSFSPIMFGLNLTLTYKNFSLYAFGNGAFGSDTFLSGNYWRMDADDKYSVIALQRWTEATKETAVYPRLTTKTAANNNQTSTFWEYKNNYFNFDKLQLSYKIPQSICHSMQLSDLSVYISGQNLAVAGTRTDVRKISTGTPVCRYYLLGFNLTF